MTHPGYEYKEVPVQNSSIANLTSIEFTASYWQDQGWETISVVMPIETTRFGRSLLLKRVKQNPTRDELSW